MQDEICCLEAELVQYCVKFDSNMQEARENLWSLKMWLVLTTECLWGGGKRYASDTHLTRNIGENIISCIELNMYKCSTGWFQKKGNPLLAAILKYFLEVIIFSVNIFGKYRLFYVRGEQIVEKDARMSLIRLFEHIWWNMTPCPQIWVFADCH